MKKLLSLAAASIALLLVLAPVASAAEFLSPADNQGNVTLSSTETHHNAYVAGGSVFVNSATTGDLYAAGGNLTIEGTVEQDLVVAGGTITVNGTVGGDVRVAGGNVTINSKVGGDLVVAGGTVIVSEKGSVGGDAMVAGGTVNFDGAVGANMKIRAGEVTINSPVFGTVDVVADKSLTFGSKAAIAGSIKYKGTQEAVVKDGAAISHVDFQKEEGRGDRGHGAGRMLAGIITLAFFVKIVGIILFGLLLLKIYPRTTRTLVQNMRANPWHNMLLGFVGLIVMPIAAVILMITLVGIYVAFLVLLVWLILALITSVIACIYAGAWVIKMINKKSEMVVDWQALVVGTVVLVIISIVPILGVLIFIALMLMAFGATLRHANAHIKDEQDSAPPTLQTPSTPTIA